MALAIPWHDKTQREQLVWAARYARHAEEAIDAVRTAIKPCRSSMNSTLTTTSLADRNTMLPSMGPAWPSRNFVLRTRLP